MPKADAVREALRKWVAKPTKTRRFRGKVRGVEALEVRSNATHGFPASPQSVESPSGASTPHGPATTPAGGKTARSRK